MPNIFIEGVGILVEIGKAQEQTDIMREAYLSFVGVYPNVVVADLQAGVFGTTAPTSHALMDDEVHPNDAGYEAIADYLVLRFIGER